MAREAKVLITSSNNAGAGIKSAITDLTSLESNAVRMAKKIQAAFSAVAVAAAAKQVVQFGIESVIAFGEVERKMTQLKVALGGNDASFDKLNKHIQTLSRVSLESKGEIQSMVAQLAALGKSDEDIKRISDAAVKLSNVTGMGLNEAMKKVNATFSGTAGELSKLIPELGTMTKEQLAAGDAVDLLNTKFKDVSDSMAGGISQQIKNMTDNFGDLKENIGQVVTQAAAPLVTFFNTIITGWNKSLEAQQKYKRAMIEDPAYARLLSNYAQREKALQDFQKRMDADASGVLTGSSDPQAELARLKRALDGSMRTLQEYELKLSVSQQESTSLMSVPAIAGAGGKGKAGANGADDLPDYITIGEYNNYPEAFAPIGGFQVLTDFDNLAGGAEEYGDQLAEVAAAMAKTKAESADTRTDFQKWMNMPKDFAMSWTDSLSEVAGGFKSWANIASGIVKTISDGMGRALESVGAALYNQTFSWENVGAAAMSVLADVLRGLGAQLAALAAVALVTFRWVDAAIAAAASIAAFIAAGVVGAYGSSLSSAGSATGGGGNGGYSGTGASYAGSQPITFNFYNQGNVVGSGGLEELAMLLQGIMTRNARYA